MIHSQPKPGGTMWCVEVNQNANPVWAILGGLNPDAYGKGLPEGEPGEVKQGFCFYVLIRENQNGLMVTTEDYLTFTFGSEPVLVAVTPEQYKHWLKQAAIAKPCTITWVPKHKPA